MHKKKRGFNLIEAAIVLGIVGLVIGGIWVAAASVSFNYKVTETTKDVGLLYQYVRNTFKGQHIASPTAILVPVTLLRNAGTGLQPAGTFSLRDRFGYSLSIEVHADYIIMQVGESNSSGYSYSSDICVALASRLAPSMRDDLIMITDYDGNNINTPALAQQYCTAEEQSLVTLVLKR